MVVVAIVMVALIGFAAIVVDVGSMYVARQRLQTAVDMAALAAGQDLPDTSQATATAAAYVQRNLSDAAVEVTFPDSDSVMVTASDTVHYTFARILGFTSSIVQASGTAAAKSMGQALDYTLFSGSETQTLTLNGSSNYVGGNSHTNKSFTANGSRLTITGACEAVTTVTTHGSQIEIGQRVPNSPYVPMPDFADTIKALAQKAGTYFAGNKTYSSSQVTVDSPIYVEGNLTINGSRFTGRGTIVATGSITFNGSSQKVSATDALAFYSRNGDITLNGSNATIDGIVYAPHGDITMNGSNQTVHGRVIGNTVTINGSSFTVASSTNDLKALPSSGMKLVH